jgi:4-diphosphocytidyl-2-C-methyl-D-erythritol kinase
MAPIHHEFAFAKLTLSLRITGRRDDGYHLISSEMVSLDLSDELWIDEAGTGLVVEDSIAWSGPAEARPLLLVPADGSNLVERALKLADKVAGVRLVKRIPAGAGLGGGSSDAAAVLRCFGVTEPALAVRLGADIPFCIVGGRALVTGVGEVIEPLPDATGYVVVVTPGFGVVTRDVYAAYDELGIHGGDGPNDLEPAALSVEPRLSRVKGWITEATGEVPTLAGSGASFFLVVSASDQGRIAGALEQAGDDSIGPVVISRCRTGTQQSS